MDIIKLFLCKGVCKVKTYPRIGIRPTIDGRQGGVRESLEEKAMKMAQAAKKLIENSLYYADGTPVQCVLASRTIGGQWRCWNCSTRVYRKKYSSYIIRNS